MRIRDDFEGLGFIAKIVSALAVELTDAEETQLARKPTENLEAYDSYLRAEIGLHGSRPPRDLPPRHVDGKLDKTAPTSGFAGVFTRPGLKADTGAKTHRAQTG